ncbi:hypothetical protein SAMN04488103_12011 [Gemmobacter aquatilis]|uniref:Polysaccharide biosynthesis enzyme WcbI domain-containing protein n=2 Tax=Gemmobacter aquatilis TaxID=933059 RepID=A0A1H8NJM0_9RHOB|nr:hypothetical protein SAMN04488103_12011 [Gemmobacter aquatilis]
MQKWLVWSNCQTEGLARSISMLCCDIEVDRAWVHEPAKSQEELAAYDAVVIHHDHTHLTAGLRKVIVAPGIQFCAYHPDSGYFTYIEDGAIKMVQGPLLGYASIIGVAAYRSGRSVKQAAELFNRDTYERAGYLCLWDTEKESLGRAFGKAGLNLGDYLPTWSRTDPFMYSINHPKIECLYDIASGILKREGYSPTKGNYLPLDGLSNGPTFPVYPEIASYYHVKGSLLFKAQLALEYMTLEHYLAGLFETLRQAPADSLAPAPLFKARFEAVCDAISK